jgi:hypothetical protein
MIIIGVDYHPSDQHIAFAATETGERGERRLNHSDGEVEKFYRDLAQRRDAQVASGSFSMPSKAPCAIAVAGSSAISNPAIVRFFK